MAKVCLDPGHGGYDPGCSGNGIDEKTEVLKITLACKKYLEQNGVNVVLTRSDDTFVSLQGRCDYERSQNVDLFVSMHLNSYNGKATGTETFAYGPGTNSEKVANIILQEINNHLGLTNRGVKYNKLHVVRNTKSTACLTESFFLDNASDYKRYLEKGGADSLGKAIAKGICKYLNINYKESVVKVAGYDTSIPNGVNKIPGTNGYVEETTDGRLIIHKDRGNYIAIGKGFVDIFYNDGNGKSGRKRITD